MDTKPTLDEMRARFDRWLARADALNELMGAQLAAIMAAHDVLDARLKQIELLIDQLDHLQRSVIAMHDRAIH
jgi:Mg2+ and Co2+ transporter CorA